LCATNTRPSSRSRSSLATRSNVERVGDHFVVDARQRGDARRDAHARMHERLPFEVQPIARGTDDGHVDDPMHPWLAARGFDVHESHRHVRVDS
jgi:hypothetical protein